MMIKVGDKVRFMDVTGGGVVTRIDGRLAFVNDEDGFEIPVLISELVLVEEHESEGHKVVQERETTEEETVAEEYEYDEEEEIDDPGFYLALLQGDAPGVQSGGVRMYLINDSNYFCYYLINEPGSNGQTINLYEGRIEPNTKIELGKQLITELDGVKWDVQIIFYKKRKPFELIPPVHEQISFKGSRLMNSTNYKDNDYLEERSYMFPLLKSKIVKQIEKEKLTEEDIDIIKKEKAAKDIKKRAKRRDEPGILEVDLHINELLDNTHSLSNTEILQIQMDKFHQVMKENLKNKKRKIIFIHGVGNGTLKTELRKALDRKYKNHYYQDASFREYGYGATMVIV